MGSQQSVTFLETVVVCAAGLWLGAARGVWRAGALLLRAGAGQGGEQGKVVDVQGEGIACWGELKCATPSEKTPCSSPVFRSPIFLLYSLSPQAQHCGVVCVLVQEGLWRSEPPLAPEVT